MSYPNPIFSADGIPVRFSRNVGGGVEEKNLIVERVDIFFKRHTNIFNVSHVYVEWEGGPLVRIKYVLIDFEFSPYFSLGAFQFTDQKVRPLFLNPVPVSSS